MNIPPYPKTSESNWAGFTLEEMQMQRALVQARMEIQKYKLRAQYEGVKENNPILGRGNSLFSRITGAFSMAEYAIFAFKIARMLTPLFKKKKK